MSVARSFPRRTLLALALESCEATVSINVSMSLTVVSIYAARHLRPAPHRLEALFHMQSLARA